MEQDVATQQGIGSAGRTIGELAALTGCPIETVRYYERAGVIAEPPRSESGRRLYDENHIRHLLFVRRARELGFSLERAKQLLRLAERADASSEAQDIAKAHLREVQQRLAELRRIETMLGRMLAECTAGAAPDCPILRPLRDGTAATDDQASG